MKNKRYRASKRWGESKTGYRAGKLAQTQREHRRRKIIFILLAGVIISVALFIAIYFLNGSGEGDSNASPRMDETDAGSVLFSVSDDDGVLNLLMLMAIGEDGGYSVITIPARTVAEVPDDGFRLMEEVYASGDQAVLDQTVANLLQYPVQYHVDLDLETLMLAAEQVGTINLKTREDVSLTVDGAQVSLPAGDNSMSSQQAFSYFMAAAVDGEGGPAVQAAFIQGLRDAFLARSETDRNGFAGQLHRRINTDLDEGGFSDLFMSVTGQQLPFSASPLPVNLAGGEADWYLEPVPGESAAVLNPQGQPVVTLEIRNGTEVAGVVEVAGEKLQPLGFPIVLNTETSGANFDFSQIKYGSNVTKEANRVKDLLGAGTLIKDEFMEKNQIIVIIGRDLAVSLQGDQ